MSLILRDVRDSPTDATWLRNVFPFYLHELSAHGAGFWWLDETGQWQPEAARECWLTRPDVSSFLLVEDGQRIGFALVGHKPFPHQSPEVDHCLGEFFVLASHRRRGLGAKAASEVLRRFPGRWELFVLNRNLPAQRFWRKLVGELPDFFLEPAGMAVRCSFRVR
jgi:predicted acetyltransferase